MFGTNTKNATGNTNDISINDVPIRTMESDLKNPGNFSSIAKTPSAQLERQMPSPFLEENKSTPATPAPIPEANPPKKPAGNLFQRPASSFDNKQAVNVNMGGPTPGEMPTSKGVKKSLIIILLIFVLVSATAGGYFFWLQRQKTKVATPTEVVPEVVSEPTIEPEIIEPIFELEKANYLLIDIKTADAVKIKDLLNEQGKKLVESEIKTPVEFVLTSDDQNTPIVFKDFATKAGIKLPTTIISNLENNFSLFILNDNSVAKLGLTLTSKNEKTLTTLLTREESKLITDLTPLFLGATFTAKNKTFSNGEYENLKIRYNNVESASDLSIDYALDGKKLIIGTSKMTLRSVYDYLKPKPTTESATPEQTSTEPSTSEQPATEQSVDNL